MEQIKVYKSFDGKSYDSIDACLVADKKYLINTIFISKINRDKLQDLFRRGSDDFWSFINEELSSVIYNNIDLYIDKTTIQTDESIKSIKLKKQSITDEGTKT